ncbi:WhiB family transcriptional regulator [Ornithinimicrobium sp. W1665]|uniref:WhiB family transcriptional regulator n=1 Tax=Ornithinimicrobium sp. W1665 TaxID=3416666 RepID=UPI003CF7475D
MSDQPEPVAALWEWQFQGLCRTTNPDIFFHPEGERGPSRRRREARAKAICEQCPVLRECREHALAVHEPYGVWGGMTEEERDEVHRRLARPRTA